MSGFTSTGATVLDNIESLPHGLLFWRSMTQWIGGLGNHHVHDCSVAHLRSQRPAVFAAEASGPTHDKVHPRIGITAKWIWGNLYRTYLYPRNPANAGRNELV